MLFKNLIDEHGNNSTKLFMRGTPRYEAGSRFKYIPDYIDFSYDNLVNDIATALDKQAEEDGEQFFTNESKNAYEDTTKDLDFDDLMIKSNQLISSLIENNSAEDFKAYYQTRIIQINLPKILTHPNDLHIYIRGGDIFNAHYNGYKEYPQPPLCFYTTILKVFKFRKIIIISEDSLNPVIPELIHKNSLIKYTKHNIKIDISYLINSYNIVAGKSSFLTSAIKFNDKLKF